MNDLQPQQSDLAALVDQKAYLTELLESGEITCAEQGAHMSCALEDIEAEIIQLIQWD